MKPTKRNLNYLFHQSNLIEGYADPEFDAQQMVAWEYLCSQHFQMLGHGDIQKVQKIVTLKQNDLQPDMRGYYRKIDVWIGGRKAMHPQNLDNAMEQWLAFYQTANALEHHIAFELIHPFVDGNGRTGRLLLWWTQLSRGDDLTKITYDDRRSYYQWFAERRV